MHKKPSTQPKKVSIIIPAYKQEKTIFEDIKSVDATMALTRWEYEIIVVVDGFLDKTFDEVKKLAGPRIKVFGYETNKGKGYAIRYGMVRATGYYISFIDAGMDIDRKGVSMLLEHMEWYDADIIVGSKRHPVSRVSYPLVRRIYSEVYHLLVRILFDIPVKDTQTGLKVFKREVLEKVLPRVLVKNFAFDVEILSVAHRLGFKKIYEAPVTVVWDSKNSNIGLTFIFEPNVRAMLLDTAAIFYRLKILKYYDDSSKRKWIYDKELEMRVNTGELSHDKI